MNQDKKHIKNAFIMMQVGGLLAEIAAICFALTGKSDTSLFFALLGLFGLTSPFWGQKVYGVKL